MSEAALQGGAGSVLAGQGSARWRVAVAAAVPLLVIATLWMAAHPYRGVIHDARLYAIQALNALDPARFANDLYFRYGSQDSFTIFSWIYRPLIATVGLPAAHLLATGLGQCLWFAAALLLMRALFGAGRECLIATAAVVLLDAGYGGFNIFRYGEAFATPRLFAEALVMMGMALALRRRWGFAAAFVLIAAALHPIMALAGMAVLAAQALLLDRRAWLAVVLGLAICLVLAILHVPPFGRLMMRFDPAWLAVVRERCGFAFMMRWPWPDYLRLASTAAVLFTVHRVGSLVERRLAAALGLASAGALLLTLLGADVLHNILVVNAQPWRVMWLTALLTNALMAVLAFRVPRAFIAHDLFLAALLFSALQAFLWTLPATWAVLAIAGSVAFVFENRRGQSLSRPWRLALLCLVGLSGALTMVFVAIQARAPDFDGSLERLAVAAAALALLILIVRRGVGPWTAVAAVVLGVAALACHDRRDDWERFLEKPDRPADLVAFVGDKPNIYFESGVELMWLKLQRPSYYSCLQGTGAMFYAGTAADYARRTRALLPLATRDFPNVSSGICPAQSGLALPEARTRADLANACRALPDLDTVILSQPLADMPARSWRAPARRRFSQPGGEWITVDRYYRYDCSDVR